MDHLLFDIGRDMSICGEGFALVWLEQSGVRVCRCDPLTCFGIRGGEAGEPLRAAVRLFKRPDDTVCGMLYEEERVTPFTWDGQRVALGAPEENLPGHLALVPFNNNCQTCGDFEMVTGLMDAYNLLLSGAMDDMQSVANAFLALYGMQGTTQGDIDEANRTRILSLAEGGRAEFVVKNLNHEALAQLESNLRRSILELSMTPDLSDERFAGNASGVAMQYKLWGIEQVRLAKERSFLDGLHRLLTALSGGFALLGTPVALEQGQVTFYKNLPQDHTALASTLLSPLSPAVQAHHSGTAAVGEGRGGGTAAQGRGNHGDGGIIYERRRKAGIGNSAGGKAPPGAGGAGQSRLGAGRRAPVLRIAAGGGRRRRHGPPDGRIRAAYQPSLAEGVKSRLPASAPVVTAPLPQRPDGASGG